MLCQGWVRDTQKNEILLPHFIDTRHSFSIEIHTKGLYYFTQYDTMQFDELNWVFMLIWRARTPAGAVLLLLRNTMATGTMYMYIVIHTYTLKTSHYIDEFIKIFKLIQKRSGTHKHTCIHKKKPKQIVLHNLDEKYFIWTLLDEHFISICLMRHFSSHTWYANSPLLTCRFMKWITSFISFILWIVKNHKNDASMFGLYQE